MGHWININDGTEVQSGNFYAITMGVKKLLKERIEDATDSTVRIMSSTLGSGTHLPSDYRTFIISPSSSLMYDQAAFSGGGRGQATVRGAIVITAKVPGSYDDVDEIENWFKRQEQTRMQILSALAGMDVYDGDGNQLTNEPLFPREAAWNKDKTLGDVMVAFDLEYDEYISAEE